MPNVEFLRVLDSVLENHLNAREKVTLAATESWKDTRYKA